VTIEGEDEEKKENLYEFTIQMDSLRHGEIVIEVVDPKLAGNVTNFSLSCYSGFLQTLSSLAPFLIHPHPLHCTTFTRKTRFAKFKQYKAVE